MSVRWYQAGSMIFLLALAACSLMGVETLTPSQPPLEVMTQVIPPPAENGQGTNSLPHSPTFTSNETSQWDDRSVFAQTLNQEGRKDLNAFPEASVYHITLNIPEDLAEALTGSLAVRYFNQESQPLEEIYFRLFPNYYGGQLKVQNVTADGQLAPTQLESDETALRLDFAQSLSPGESVVIQMEYDLLLPETMGGNYGLLGYFDDILVLDTFYPMIPAYDQHGWYAQVPFENGDLTYNDASFYLVEVSAPADLVLAASGSEMEESRKDGVQTITFAAGPARDFYLAGSKSFSSISREVNGITVNSYAREGFQTHQEYALEDAIQAIETFSDLLGPYPYSEFDVISSPMMALGIEYPGITGIFWELYLEDKNTLGIANRALLESVIVHEVAHQWFYNAVGNDQQNQPWVDEALAQYMTYVYFLQNYGEAAAQAFPASWQQRLAVIEDTTIPVGLPAGAYDRQEYGAIVYGKGPKFFQMLEDSFGRQVLWETIASYYQTHLWMVSDTEDLRASLEEGCGCDLTDVFEVWVYQEDSGKE